MDGGPAAKRSKLLQRADDHMEKGEYYEAAMMFKGQVVRGSTEKATALGIEGVGALTSRKQGDIAVDLATAVVDKVGMGVVQDLANVLQPDPAAQRKFLLATLASPAGKEAPKPTLTYIHMALGNGYVDAKDYSAAQKHFVAAGGAGPLADLLAVWAASAPDAEVPLFYTRAFLLLLAHGDADAAAHLLTRTPPHALRDYDAFIYKAVARNAQPLFTKVVAMPAYAGPLGRDPALGKALDVIGTLYFGTGKFAGKVKEQPTAVPKPAPAPAPVASSSSSAAPRLGGGLGGGPSSAGVDLD